MRLAWEHFQKLMVNTKTENNFSYAELSAYFTYDFETGLLYRIKDCPNASKRPLPRLCGNVERNGYLVVSFRGKVFKVHRLIWFLYYKKMPQHQIDHINGNKLDNRIENLRDVPRTINCRNKLIHRQGKAPGVKKHGKGFLACFRENGIEYNLGCYATKQEAEEVYRRYMNGERELLRAKYMAYKLRKSV